MLKQALLLWKNERSHKGSTLQRRLILFFGLIITGIILLLIMLLTLFGITGSGQHAVHNYAKVELTHLSDQIKTDFGNISVEGIELAETLSKKSDGFFSDHNISASELASSPALIEPLLSELMPDVVSVSQVNSCGGTFVLLDASVNTQPEAAPAAKAGLFIKKTQPVSSGATKGKSYLLRGPASIGRENGVELMGQWKMEYDITGEDFFLEVMQTAREHPELPISRLYYWSERVTLKENSESGFLLCVPLRSSDGAVFGVCGIEVSLRMFQQLYSPQDNTYPNLLTLAAALDGEVLRTESGLAGGGMNAVNTLLSEDLTFTRSENSFLYYSGRAASYGGLSQGIAIYPKDSSYADQELCVAVLFPQADLAAAIRGNSANLFVIVLILFVCSITASVFISRRYLNPLIKMFDAVKNKKEDVGSFNIPEIDEFFELLAQESKAQAENLHSVDSKRQKAEEKYVSAQKLIEQLSADRIKGFDPDRYAMFLSGIKLLTKTQRKIFMLYLEGHSLKEVREIRSYSTDALKWHNKEIYSKLGVSSLKELMVYAPIIKMEVERNVEL